jgi:peptidoglycan/xylan/chitin deacetylase (PgdA/CDA1 family)
VSALRVALHHHVTDRPGELEAALGNSTRPDLFEQHVRRLARDYDVVALDDVLAGRLPRRALLLTFDDGYRSVVDIALPILARLGLPSVVFVSAVHVDPEALPVDNLLCHLAATVGVERLERVLTGRPGTARTRRQWREVLIAMPYERRARLGAELADAFEVDQAAVRARSGLFLAAHELAGLAALGCEVGNHTRSHVYCRTLTDEAAAHAELVAPREQLEAWTGAAVRSFAYPYGALADATPLVERTLRESGHEMSFLVESRPNRRSHHGRTLNRVSLDGSPAWQLGAKLELLPQLRRARDLVRAA